MSEFTQVLQDTRGLSGFDYLTAGTQPSEKGVAAGRRNSLRVWTPGTWSRAEQAKFGMWELSLYDFSQQGFNHPEGLFSQHSNGFTVSSMITDEPNSLLLPPARTTYTTPVPTGDIVGLHHAYVFDTLIVGAGSGANVSLWKQTSTTDPTPSAITYSPAASICSLSKVLDDGVERLAVGRIGAATQLHSDAAATVATTMHSSTNSTWGIIMSGLNATDPGVPTMLIYAGTTIGTKAANADLTTAITTSLTGINAGGFAIGAITPGGRAQKAFWAIPKKTTTAGALKFDAEVLMDIWYTNMEATEILPLKLEYLPNGIRGAIPYRLGLVAWDDDHIVYWDGDEEYDLGIFRRRIGAAAESWVSNVLNSDFRRRVRCVRAVGGDLYVLTNTYELPDAASLAYYFLEKYKFETGTWHNAGQVYSSGDSDAGTANANLFLCGQGGLPYSPDTKRAYNFETQDQDDWVAWFLPRPGESLLWQHSLGSGAQTTNIPTYVRDARFLSSEWRFDGITYNPKVVTELEFGGNLNHGGSNAYTLTISVKGHQIQGTSSTAINAASETFSQGKNVADYKRKNKGWANVFDIQLLFATDAVGGSDLRTNIEMLPVTVRGLFSKDGSLITAANCPEVFAS